METPLKKGISKFYLPILKERYDDPPKREPDLELLVSFAASYRNRNAYLTDMPLPPVAIAPKIGGHRTGGTQISHRFSIV